MRRPPKPLVRGPLIPPAPSPQAEVRKAYLRLAVQLHPDKNPGEDAKERFQDLQKLYSVLSDPERRKVYDATGSVEDSEELAGKDFGELYAFFRGLFKKVQGESGAPGPPPPPPVHRLCGAGGWEPAQSEA